MTGPEHFREAERLLMDAVVRRLSASKYDSERLTYNVNVAQEFEAHAQVHATLALAAATALGREGEGRTMASKDRAAWFDVAAECRKAGAS